MLRPTASLALLTLAACAPEPSLEIPETACRERAAVLTDLPMEETSASVVSTNAFGILTFETYAGRSRFQCVVSETGVIASFQRI